MRKPFVGWRRLVPSVCAVTVVLAAVARPLHAAMSAADTRAIAEMALQWAVAGGISDFKLVKDPSRLIVSNVNLPDKVQLHVPGHKVTLLSPLRIQAYADIKGDFLYFRFGLFTLSGQHATVPIALVWAVSVRSTASYLSGGGATLEFEKRDGKWQLLPVTERWAS